MWTEIKIVELHLHVTWPAAALLEESGETNRDIVLTAALVCIAAMLSTDPPPPYLTLLLGTDQMMDRLSANC